jgi:hypothetical protein
MDKFRYEENEGEDEESEEGVAYNFADNVPIKDAHDAKSECNMGKRRRVGSGMERELQRDCRG